MELVAKLGNCIYRTFSTVTPIKTKQETVRPRPEGRSSENENAWFWTDPTRRRRSWTRLIQVTVGRVGDGSFSSPNSELDCPINVAVGRRPTSFLRFPRIYSSSDTFSEVDHTFGATFPRNEFVTQWLTIAPDFSLIFRLKGSRKRI
ncbi:hypothetical protein YC2023_094240 [Brassica napus]